MWLIVALYVISLPLLLLARIAKTERMKSVSFCIGGVAAIAAFYLVWKNEAEVWPTFCFALIYLAASDLIERRNMRRRIIPPCVRVKVLGRDTAVVIGVVIFFAIFLVMVLKPESWRFSFGWIMVLGLLTYFPIQKFFDKVLICRNGVWHSGMLNSWDEYKSFSWFRKATDNAELRLEGTSWLSGATRLLVSPEDRESVHELLEAHLPELTE